MLVFCDRFSISPALIDEDYFLDTSRNVFLFFLKYEIVASQRENEGWFNKFQTANIKN